MPVPRVLVVDDNDQSCTLAIRILELDGYEAVAVCSVAEARRELAGTLFQAVLIDIQMPGESGIELLRTVRACHPRTAPIMVTASVDPETMALVDGIGAAGYLVKPYGIDELLASLGDALRPEPTGQPGQRNP